jgi:hypothetical protein
MLWVLFSPSAPSETPLFFFCQSPAKPQPAARIGADRTEVICWCRRSKGQMVDFLIPDPLLRCFAHAWAGHDALGQKPSACYCTAEISKQACACDSAGLEFAPLFGRMFICMSIHFQADPSLHHAPWLRCHCVRTTINYAHAYENTRDNRLRSSRDVSGPQRLRAS